MTEKALTTLRLHFGAEHALCDGQYSAALDAEQGSVLCNALGWEAGGLLCAPWSKMTLTDIR